MQEPNRPRFDSIKCDLNHLNHISCTPQRSIPIEFSFENGLRDSSGPIQDILQILWLRSIWQTAQSAADMANQYR